MRIHRLLRGNVVRSAHQRSLHRLGAAVRVGSVKQQGHAHVEDLEHAFLAGAGSSSAVRIGATGWNRELPRSFQLPPWLFPRKRMITGDAHFLLGQGDEEIGGLDIPMHHACFMGMLEP